MLDGYIYNSNLFKNDFQYKFDETGRKIENFFIFQDKTYRNRLCIPELLPIVHEHKLGFV